MVFEKVKKSTSRNGEEWLRYVVRPRPDNGLAKRFLAVEIVPETGDADEGIEWVQE